MPQPVFLLSPARSYSTVSLALLSGHPGIFGFPEMLLFGAATVGDVLASTVRRSKMPEQIAELRLNGICRAIAEIHEGTQGPAELARARAWLEARTSWDTGAVMRDLMDRIDPLVGMEKSPETATDDGLARCIRAFPQARFIHLTRHPVTTQQSMREHYWWQHRDRSPASRSASCASAWYLSHRTIMRELSALPDDQWMRIRAEDLLREPKKFAPPVFAWLGLEHDEKIVDDIIHTENWRFAGYGESGRLAGGDPKFLRDPRLRPVPEPGPIVFPEEWGLLDEMIRRMTELALELGY